MNNLDKNLELKVLERSLFNFLSKREEWIVDCGEEIYL